MAHPPSVHQGRISSDMILLTGHFLSFQDRPVALFSCLTHVLLVAGNKAQSVCGRA